MLLLMYTLDLPLEGLSIWKSFSSKFSWRKTWLLGKNLKKKTNLFLWDLHIILTILCNFLNFQTWKIKAIIWGQWAYTIYISNLPHSNIIKWKFAWLTLRQNWPQQPQKLSYYNLWYIKFKLTNNLKLTMEIYGNYLRSMSRQYSHLKSTSHKMKVCLVDLEAKLTSTTSKTVI